MARGQRGLHEVVFRLVALVGEPAEHEQGVSGEWVIELAEQRRLFQLRNRFGCSTFERRHHTSFHLGPDSGPGVTHPPRGAFLQPKPCREPLAEWVVIAEGAAQFVPAVNGQGKAASELLHIDRLDREALGGGRPDEEGDLSSHRHRRRKVGRCGASQPPPQRRRVQVLRHPRNGESFKPIVIGQMSGQRSLVIEQGRCIVAQLIAALPAHREIADVVDRQVGQTDGAVFEDPWVVQSGQRMQKAIRRIAVQRDRLDECTQRGRSFSKLAGLVHRKGREVRGRRDGNPGDLARRIRSDHRLPRSKVHAGKEPDHHRNRRPRAEGPWQMPSARHCSPPLPLEFRSFTSSNRRHRAPAGAPLWSGFEVQTRAALRPDASKL